MSDGALSAVHRELLALLLAESGSAAPPPAIAPAPAAGPAPLSSAQMRLWFLHAVDPGCTAFNVPSAVRLEGELDRAVLRRAWAEVVRRHQVLRTRFPSRRGEPVQEVAPAAPPPVPLVDLAGLAVERREAETARLARAEARRPFDLARGPLLRLVLFALGEAGHVLLWTVHHIVFDGWSRRIVVGELVTVYAALAAGRTSPLPEPTVQYADFARWQRSWSDGPEAEAQLAYWRRKLAGVRELRLPADRPAAAASFRGETRTFDWPAELSAAVHERARAAGATPFIVLLAGFKLALADWTGHTDLVVGTDVAGRGRLETEDLVGFFINQLVLRTDVGGDPSFDEVVARVRRSAREAYEHQDLPFDRLVKELAPDRGLERLPLFQVKLIYQPARAQGLPVLPGLEVSPLTVEGGTAQLDLTLSIHQLRDGLGGWFNYSTDRFERATIEELLWRYETLLGLALDDPAASASQLFAALREAERARRAERSERRAAARRERWAARRLRPVSLIPETI